MAGGHFLLSSGSNARGQLGIGSADDSHLFQKCSFECYPPFHFPTHATQIIDVAAGANHTIILLEFAGHKREIWGSGDGSKGQLGRFSSQNNTQRPSQTSIFRKIELPLLDAGLGDYSVKLIGANWETSYVVLACEGRDDVVVSMGSDDFGDLGIGGLQSVNGDRVFNIIDFEHLFNEGGLVQKRDRLVVNSITSGQRHVILDLRLFFCGKSSFEQVVVGWGMSRHGQLGVAGSSIQKPPSITSTPHIIPLSRQPDPIIATSLGLQHSILLHASGQVTALGSSRKGQLQIVSDIEGAKDVKCTWNGTYYVVQDSSGWSVLSFGSNMHGQLGYEGSSGRVAFPATINTTDTSVRIACGSEHVLALIKSLDENPAIPNSQVWGWGWNEHGNLGLGTTDDVKLPVRIWPLGVDTPVDVSGIWAGCGTSWIYCKYREH